MRSYYKGNTLKSTNTHRHLSLDYSFAQSIERDSGKDSRVHHWLDPRTQSLGIMLYHQIVLAAQTQLITLMGTCC